MPNLLNMLSGRKIKRVAKIERKTKETEISCVLNIDGEGRYQIDTGIGLLNHMLELFTFHGLFDLKLKARGDLSVDLHHTNEDIGIVLGQVFRKALTDMRGIARFGFASVPMEDILASVILDISGRGHFTGIWIKSPDIFTKKENYGWDYVNHFFESFAKQSGINLIIRLEINPMPPAIDIHTALEPIFKAWAIALDRATSIDPRRKGIPSTKGIID